MSPARKGDTRREEARLRALLESVRAPEWAPPGFAARVMARVRREGRPAWRRALDWLLRPRAVRVTPAGALLAGAAAALVLWAAPWSGGPAQPGEGPAQAGAGTAQVVTRFVFVAPQAGSVHLTGDFVAWDQQGVPLDDARGNGVWMVDLPLDPGVYQYAFVVDGLEWSPDPLAVSQVDDGFGRQNSVVIVTQGA
ncbi:MAG: isoamylase early set domain-containing protein [Longimicrobiales bacterium]|nr:isoamylase early set domain-containing protein [Longimicrobiales bacterium]